MADETNDIDFRERERAVAEYTQRMEADRLRSVVEANRRVCGVPARYGAVTFDHYRAVLPAQQKALALARHYAERFDFVLKSGASLTMLGLPGTGKTHLACAIANALLDKGRSVLYRTAYQLLREVKATWSNSNSGDSEADVMKRFASASLLIVDEVGVQFGSDTERILLFDLLNTRYAELKPTIVVSNLAQAGLVDFLGERMWDRLTETGSLVIPFDWHSYRRHRDA